MLPTDSPHDFSETVARLRAAIERHQMTLFAVFDHAGAARDAGLELADEQVLVFGNPRAGTRLMQTDPRVGIELPLRILVWSTADGVVVGYNDPRVLAASYDLSAEDTTLDTMAQLLSSVVNEATS